MPGWLGSGAPGLPPRLASRRRRAPLLSVGRKDTIEVRRRIAPANSHFAQCNVAYVTNSAVDGDVLLPLALPPVHHVTLAAVLEGQREVEGAAPVVGAAPVRAQLRRRRLP